MEETFSNSATSAEDVLQVVVFQLAGEEFGMDIMNVKEIIRIPEMTHMPQAPDYVEGIVNIRGDVIVAINMAKLFNVQFREQDHNSRIIVTELDDIIVGLMVESVTEVLRIQKSEIDPAPDMLVSRNESEAVKGVGKLDERLLLLIDSKKVLGKDEQLNIVESGYKEAVSS
ncbi:chemotaxis protein CheW [Methanolobus bombayensis]|uniref:chemotaxis protein CheW n=1 Tax=Methanolobus bombayensis TaxID=38023 RepID=UPI003157F961|nr:purine-binding chemotaxis protein CheW [Methanolobus bombayensis]